MIFRLDYPPTVNHYWRRGAYGQMYVNTAGKAYRSAAMEFARDEPLTGRLRICIDATMPDRRKRDLDNIQKAVLDAIVHAKIVVDDSQFDEILIRRLSVDPPGCVDVIIESI